MNNKHKCKICKGEITWFNRIIGATCHYCIEAEMRISDLEHAKQEACLEEENERKITERLKYFKKQKVTD